MSNPQIPLINLQKEFHFLKKKMLARLTKVMENGEFIGGKELETFEQNFAQYLGVNHVIGVASGTAALFLSLKALNIGENDEVITNAMSFNATPESIMYTGAKPIFVDIQEDDGGINCDLIENSITKKTRAILVVHLYGVPANMDKLQALCKKYDIFLIEDCAQAHGAAYKGKKVGTYGIIGCFSFMPAKNIGAYGDAGCIATNDARIASTIRKLKDHGRASKYMHDILGYAERMDNLQAAVINVKLPYLDKWNKIRNNIAKTYERELSKYVKCLDIQGYKTCSYYVFPLLTERRDELKEYLERNGIGTNIYYPISLHQQIVYTNTYKIHPILPVAEYRASHNIAIPMHPFLTKKEIQYIIQTIKTFFEKQGTGLSANEYIQTQYNNTDKLQTRLSLWEKRGTNKDTIHDFIFDHIRSYIQKGKQYTLLDVGCGTGIFLKKLQVQKDMQNINVFAVDSAISMVNSTQKLLKTKNVIEADIAQLPYKDNTFDIITAIHVLHHIHDKEKAIQEMTRVTKKGGICIITVSEISHKKGLNKVHYEGVKKFYFPEKMRDHTKHGIDANQQIQYILQTKALQWGKNKYKNNMHCTSMSDIIKYYKSGMMTRGSNGRQDSDVGSKQWEQLEKYIQQKVHESIKKKGYYIIPGHVDVFIWTKE